jgi:hypothetical protein
MLKLKEMTCLLSRWALVLGLLALPIVACGETTGAGGSGGTGGTGGMAGSGGSAGSGGTGGTTGQLFPCTEQGIRDAIAEGGGPHFFDCDGPQTAVIQAEIVIDNDVILDGEGELTVNANLDHRVFQVAADVETELRGVTLTGGFADRLGGGGISNYQGTLTLTNSTVAGNAAEYGGGIHNYLGTLTLTNSTVSGNTASMVGGGILFAGFSVFGTLTLTNSTVSGNAAEYGGGIYNGGALTLVNVTVSGNEAEQGSGIANPEICNLFVCFTGMLDIRNTLVDGDCITMGDATTTNNGYNIESPGNTCGFDQPTDQVNVSAEDLKLGPLADNGGPTMTHALLPGSVAIDQILEADCQVDTDQRGQPRPEPGGTLCDVGAFEVQP